MKEPSRMGTRVVIVRHGQTEWNRVERFRGRIDIELNDTGQLQAEAVAESLSASHIGAIYSSPLKRALQTAQPTARACHLDVGILEAITDVDYGALAGLSPGLPPFNGPDRSSLQLRPACMKLSCKMVPTRRGESTNCSRTNKASFGRLRQLN